MDTETLKQQIIDAIANGKIQATTINIGDQIQNQQNYNIEGAGDIRIQIVSPDAPAVAEFVDEHAAKTKPETPTKVYEQPLPREGKYNEVREYIEERMKEDPDFKIFCKTHNRKELCDYLTNIFGWIVDAHALGTNINRHG